MESLGEKIYNLRTDSNLSQDSLAEKLRVSRQTVSRWETDSSKPTKVNIKGLCEVFGVDKNYFSAYVESTATDDATAKSNSPSNKKSWILLAVVFSGFLICCIVACCVAGYASLKPSYINGLNNAVAGRFRYIGIACIVVGALALITLIVLLIFVIKNKKKRKK